jgi:hypothetical protein
MVATGSQTAPPHIAAALEQIKSAIRSVDGRSVDEQTTPWAEIEKSIIKLLGGAFRIDRADHQTVALGLAGMYAARLINQHQAFWFPNREALEGAALGFPEALLVVSPFGAVAEALSRGDLPKLDSFAKEIAASLTQARFSATGGGTLTKLGADDYQRIFDPSFVQFVAINPTKAKAVWDANVSQLITDLRDALSRAGARFPKEARTLVEARMITVLQRLDPSKKLREQGEKAPRVFELMTHLFATVEASGLAPEEFWAGVVFPLLHIGAPADFPPVEQDDVTAFGKGMDALLLFVDLIPYQTSAPEDGPLGAFGAGEVSLLDPEMPPASATRLVKVDPKRLGPLLNALQPGSIREAVNKFTGYLQRKGSPAPVQSSASPLLDPALNLLDDLKKLWNVQGGPVLAMRHLTEAEASLEPALAELRKVLQGPRIILL